MCDVMRRVGSRFWRAAFTSRLRCFLSLSLSLLSLCRQAVSIWSDGCIFWHLGNKEISMDDGWSWDDMLILGIE
ncbi:hypothetical protein B0T18DRAFT_416862 [Schizothecium vesticola]|uniref:Secreted protein n=1 Tax=Schizothecium vesticola TaxID=314040 RepID=A0AA40K385_9PEZI|nr:hypothetical protein B0T18DRAFT_416862 [Schizothecium vesticola]